MDNKEIFKPGDWVYFMHKDLIHCGRIYNITTNESITTKEVVYSLDSFSPNGNQCDKTNVFHTKQKLLDFLVENIQSDVKS